MRKKISPHWFLDRWCAELVVEDGRQPKEVGWKLGVSYGYVVAAIARVHHCTIGAARAKWCRRARHAP